MATTTPVNFYEIGPGLKLLQPSFKSLPEKTSTEFSG
jgi:hypothetical protein